jgi:hypothetical protein
VTTPSAQPSAARVDDQLTHTVCSFCNPDRALCGKDMTGRVWLPWDGYPDDCIVCDELAEPHVGNCTGRRDG